MNFDYFPKFQPTIVSSYSSFNPKISQPFDFKNYDDWKVPQKPFAKAKTAKIIDHQNKQDKFEQLLKKIQKVKQDYEQDHNSSTTVSYSPKEQNLSFKQRINQTTDDKVCSKALKRARTMKDIDLVLGINKFLDNSPPVPKSPLNLKKLYSQKQFQFNPQLVQFQQKNSRTNQQNTQPQYLNIQKLLKTNVQDNLHSKPFSLFSSIQNKRPLQIKKTIAFDPNILEKVPVRQSINIDLDNFTELQASQQFGYIFNQKEQLKFSDFQLGACIGSGKFGQVYICRHKKTNFVCALKKIMKSTIEEYKMVDQFIRELKISYMVDHPNVIKTYGHFHDEFHVFLLMEYAGDGCAIDNLQYKKSEQFSSNVLFQTLNAVDHLHRLKIVHRDIKPQNIVVFFKDTYKLCDFGLSAFVDNDMKHTFCGTPDYLSPEMKDIGEYDFSVDLWSLGVLAFQLIFGQPPFKDKISEWKKSGWKKSSDWKWKVQYPSQISQIAKNFIQELLKQKPEQRLNIWSCLRQQFIKKHCKKEMDLIKAAEVSGF